MSIFAFLFIEFANTAFSMLWNYLKITFRNLRKNPLYAFINIFGLALSIACFTVVFLLIRHETSYDKSHSKADRIFRVIEFIEKSGVGEHAASVPFPLGATLQHDFPKQIEKVVRLFNYQAPSLSIAYDSVNFNEKHFYFADSSFFEVFDFPLILGNSQTVLSSPNQVIISPAIAKKYFGKENPIGKTITLQGDTPLNVVGVFETLPTASHFNFEFIASLSTLNKDYISRFYDNWRWNPCWTYILLKDAEDSEVINENLEAFVKKYFDKELKNNSKLFLQSLDDIHLHSALDYEMDTNGDVTYIYIFSVIAIFILLIAAINFMNLSTAKSSLRAKEIVVRKVLGADNSELVQQFLLESVALGSIAIFIAFILIETMAPHLTDFSGKPLPPDFVHGRSMIFCIVITGSCLGFLAGLYPAYCLAAYNPLNILRGKFELGYGNKWFRRTTVLVQFVIAALLLITTFVSQKQLDFMRNSELGFDEEQVLIIPIGQRSKVIEKYEDFKNQLLQDKNILAVTAMEEILGASHQTHRFTPEGLHQEAYFPSLRVRYDFLKTFNIKLLTGRDFTEYRDIEKQYRLAGDSSKNAKQQNDEYDAVIINEAMVKHLGWESPEKAIGKAFASPRGRERVVGVVENFHFSSLHTEVMPFVLDMPKDYEKLVHTKYIAVKFAHHNIAEVNQYVKKIWATYTKIPFDAFLLRENLNSLYRKEQQLSEVAQIFSIIGIFIACMGLFGLSSFVIENRYREIGIRKALGAKAIELVLLLSQNFVLTVIFSLLIAGAIGGGLMQWWLSSFSYHVNIDVFILLKTALIVIGVTILTVSYHTFKAAMKNPIDVIRHK